MMHRVLCATVLMTGVFAGGAFAGLVEDFANCLPANYKAQMAWAKTDGKLYIVDSDVGEVTSLQTTNAVDPHLTADGTRIIYRNGGTGGLWVINWDGTGAEEFYSNGANALEDYYKDPDTDIEYAVTYGPIQRVNIATGEEANIDCSAGDDGIRISPDGKYVVGDLDGIGFGYCEVNGGQSGGDFCNGTCNCNIAPDLNYRLMIQYEGHNKVMVCRFPGVTSGTEYKSGKDITASIRNAYPWTNINCQNNGQGSDYGFESTRWVASDYVTMIMTNSSANPFLVKLSDPTKWVALEENVDCAISQGFMCSSVSALIYERGTVGINCNRNTAHTRFGIDRSSASYVSYLPDGRRISEKALSANSGSRAGIVIRRFAQNGASKLAIIQ